MSAASAPPRAASHVPGPISVIVSKAKKPVRAQVAAGTAGRDRPEQRRGGGRSTARPRSWPGSSGSPAASHSAHAPARKSSSAGSWTASSAASSCAVAATTGWPAASSAARIASARAGSSTAGVRTPTQISARRLVPPVRLAPHERDRGRHRSASLQPYSLVRACPVRPIPAAPGCASSGCGSARSRPGRRTRSPTSRACGSATSRSGATRRRWRARGVTAIAPGDGPVPQRRCPPAARCSTAPAR